MSKDTESDGGVDNRRETTCTEYPYNKRENLTPTLVEEVFGQTIDRVMEEGDYGTDGVLNRDVIVRGVAASQLVGDPAERMDSVETPADQDVTVYTGWHTPPIASNTIAAAAATQYNIHHPVAVDVETKMELLSAVTVTHKKLARELVNEDISREAHVQIDDIEIGVWDRNLQNHG